MERRSLGWSVADLAGRGASDGLVEFFEHRRRDIEVPQEGLPLRITHQSELIAQGIARGSPLLLSQTKFYTQQLFPRQTTVWDGAACEMDVTVRFTQPRASLLAAAPQPSDAPESWNGFVPTFSIVKRDASQSDVPATERRVQRTLTIGAPRRQRPAGAPMGDLWYYPIEGIANDAEGNQQWGMNGLVINPLAPRAADGDLQGLTLTFHERDSLGRATRVVLDAAPGSAPVSPDGGTVPVPEAPAGWSPISSVPAFNYVTAFRYAETGRLIDTFLPNGRIMATRQVIIMTDEGGRTLPRDRWFMREYVFTDVFEADEDSRWFYTEQPAEIRDYFGLEAQGSPRRTRKVDMTGPFVLEFWNEADQPVNYRERAEVRLGVDENGRIAEATLLEPDDSGAMLAVGSKEVNDLVDVLREREIDGTITRVTRNAIGQPLRTYVGTIDDGWTGVQTPTNYDMVLRERLEYGVGVNDVRQPTITRSYSSVPSWAGDHHGVPPANDVDGMATVTTYDWRGRAVRTDEYERGEPGPGRRKRSTTLTFLDFAGRSVLDVTFGENTLTLPSHLDPAALGPNDAIPEPAAFLNLAVKPTGLSTTHYGPDGSSTERRAYDVASSTPQYISTFTYLGRGGQGVFTHTVGQPASVAVVDGVGRVHHAARVAAGWSSTGGGYGYQLSRTDYTYDADGNVVTTTQWERVREGGDSLTEANAVPSRSHSWYDTSRRAVASLEVGTENAAGYVAGATPWDRFAAPFNEGEARPYIGCPNDGGVIDLGALDDKLFDDCEVNGQLVLGNVQTIPQEGRLTISRFNKAGQLTHMRNADGTITKHLYAQTGRLAEKIENAWGAPELRRTTRYGYRFGRVVQMATSRQTGPGEPTWQYTDVRYGATIVDDGFTPVSRQNTLVGELYLPHPVSGRSRLSRWTATPDSGPNSGDYATPPAMTIRYTIDGKIAERIDGRGMAFRYRYDDQRRLASIEVGHYQGIRATTKFLPGYPSWSLPTGIKPSRVGYVEYSYDTRGNLQDVRAFGRRGDVSPLTHNRFATDERGDLLSEWQAIGAVNALTPAVGYQWEYIAGDPTNPLAAGVGVHRLVGMTMPAAAAGVPSTQPGTGLELSYGDEDTLDRQLSRLTRIRAVMGAESRDIAGFEYVGEMRRSAQTWGGFGGVPELAFNADPMTGDVAGQAALDRFGRWIDRHVRGADGITRWRGEYGFDVVGNRLTATLTQNADPNPDVNSPVPSSWSHRNDYDQLQRLTGTTFGTVVGGEIPPASVTHETHWKLDLLGNWTGAAAGTTGPPGLERLGNLDQYGTLWAKLNADASTDVNAFTHDVNERNGINSVRQWAGDVGGTLAPLQMRPVYDGAGNLVFDGRLVYLYDAWGRVIEVRQGSLKPNVPVPDPRSETPPDPYARVAVGAVVKSYTYDGLGRLVTTSTPLPNVNGVRNRARVERFIYDGVRRVQEFVTESAPTPTAQPSAWLERQYIWGPGDGIAGVDELLCQLDGAGRPWWVIQDGGGDIVALASSADSRQSYARIVAQWHYDAYGTVIAADHFAQHPLMHAGHKGLFFDRVDVGEDGLEHPEPGSTQGLPTRDGFGQFVPSGREPPRLAPLAQCLYHVRNRAYVPHLGRWLQMDPNASGQSLLSAAAYAGRGFSEVSAVFGLEERYGDGLSLYEYLGSNGWGRFDAGGLSWDPFSMVDDYMAEDMGSKKAFLEDIVGGVQVAVYVGAYLASNLPFVPGPVALVGEVVLFAMEEPGALTENGTWQLIKSGFEMAGQVQDAIGSMLNPINHLSAAAGIVSDVINGEFGPESMMEAFETLTGQGGDEEEFEEGGDGGEYAVAGALTGIKKALRKAIRKTRADLVHVYVIVEELSTGRVALRYFGISKNLEVRGRAHGHDLIKVGPKIPRKLAMVIETWLMQRHGTLGMFNRTRSLGTQHEFYSTAMHVAGSWVKRHFPALY